MLLIYCLLSGLCVVLATTGLLTQSLSFWKKIILVVYVTGMALIANIYLDITHILGILMMVCLLVLIFFMLDEYKILNIFLACMGYLLSVVGNNGVLFLIAKVFGIPVRVIENFYWFEFTVSYVFVLGIFLYILRKILFDKIKIQKLFIQMSKVTQYSLTANMAVYIVIFLINISLGEKAGYSVEALQFNNILFLICMIASSVVLVECTKGIETEERRKAKIHQQEVLESYVSDLETMVDEMRAFRHDYKNMLSTMSGYLRENQIQELKEYFYQKIQVSAEDGENQIEAWKYLKDIEPMELKGFLYEKILLILTRNIMIRVEVSSNLNVVYYDMEDLIRILGIFIDNAVEETEQLVDGEVYIIIAKTKKGILFHVENNYKEKPNLPVLTQKGYSTRGKERGMGLYWGEKIICGHSDMFHETRIIENEKRFIQLLEIAVE